MTVSTVCANRIVPPVFRPKLEFSDPSPPRKPLNFPPSENVSHSCEPPILDLIAFPRRTISDTMTGRLHTNNDEHAYHTNTKKKTPTQPRWSCDSKPTTTYLNNGHEQKAHAAHSQDIVRMNQARHARDDARRKDEQQPGTLLPRQL